MKLLHWDLVRNLLRSAPLLLFLLLNWIILCDLRVLSWLLYPQLSSFLNFLLNLDLSLALTLDWYGFLELWLFVDFLIIKDLIHIIFTLL